MMRHELRTVMVVGVAVLGLALGVPVAGHQQPGQDVRATQTGSVDFVVVARDGQPVADLKADEVTLRIDGKVRPIKSLQFVRVSSGMGGSGLPAAAQAAQVAPAFATNLATVTAVARSIMLVVDDESIPIGQETKLRAALSNFARDLPETDQVALVTVPHGGIKVGFTTDRDRLAKAIADISPIAPMDAAPCRTLTTLSTLETTLAQLSRTSGEQPVVVALLSSALAGTSGVEQAPDARSGQSLSAGAGGCNLRADDFARAGQAVAAAHAQLYIIHPDFNQQPAADGIGNLQGQTNAPLFHLTSNTEPGLSRMARETAGYYTATFETEPEELTGKPHTSSVKSTRKDVEVRDRPFLIVGRAAPTASSISPATSGTTVITAFDMVRSGKLFRDLPLRATASPSRNPPTVDATGAVKSSGAVDVIGLFEPIDPSVTIMTAAAALIDESGKAMAYWQSADGKPMTTWPVAIGLTVKPGKYRLRLAAIDSNGRMGLIDDPLVAELQPAGPLQLGGLVLGLSRSGGFSPRMQFSTEASAIAYMELYGGQEGTQLSVVFEVARTTDGPAMLNVIGTLAATNEDGKFTATGTIPVGALQPGDYVVRGVVTVAGQGSGRVLRTLHKAG